VLEEMRETGPAPRFVAGADVVPDVDAYHLRRAIGRQDDLEAVVQRVRLESYAGRLLGGQPPGLPASTERPIRTVSGTGRA
jgi:hypothetical protein